MQEKRVNIIILNYNGKPLLRKYLPSVIEASGKSCHECRVSVIDNKSTDGSAAFVKENFKEVVLYEALENRVLCSYNEFLRSIDDEIVIFLNTDIRVDPYFVDPLVGHFDDEDVLFVSPKELSMNGQYQGNLNKAKFRFGTLSVKVEEEDYNRLQYDISVHGGAFDREKFLFLGGYDDIYLPGIVEDFDLCYRGWKYGWKGIYEPASFYYHEGSTSFNKKYGERGKSLLAYRNTYLFLWKNITSRRLIFYHVVFTPILLLAALLRLRWLVIKGFFQALRMLPIVLKRRISVTSQFRISDEELIMRASLPYQSITEPPQTSI